MEKKWFQMPCAKLCNFFTLYYRINKLSLAFVAIQKPLTCIASEHGKNCITLIFSHLIHPITVYYQKVFCHKKSSSWVSRCWYAWYAWYASKWFFILIVCVHTSVNVYYSILVQNKECEESADSAAADSVADSVLEYNYKNPTGILLCKWAEYAGTSHC